MIELIEAVKLNTTQQIKLKKEVRKARKVEEKNVKFLQDLLMLLITDKQKIENSRWDMAAKLANWGLKIGAVVILGYLAAKGFIFT